MLERHLQKGLRVLVTAGAAGIGREIVRALVGDGARVHICDVDAAALDDARREHAVTTSVTDVAEVEQVERLFVDVRDHLGGLDVLVNNAGIAGPTAPVESVTPVDWRRTIAVNLDGQFYCTRLAVPLLRESRRGVIVNMSSVAGRFGYPFRTPYAASKWAVVGFTQSLARELGPDGITVNAILPGPVEGPRIERVIRARAELFGVSYEEMEARYRERAALRRLISPQDIAAMVVFLCSEAGRNITGQSLSVCGGVDTLEVTGPSD
jgi:NAD(P)-dependent dehydrogenase (short-subunit alcohol dehydrogenase family)